MKNKRLINDLAWGTMKHYTAVWSSHFTWCNSAEKLLTSDWFVADDMGAPCNIGLKKRKWDKYDECSMYIALGCLGENNIRK